MNFFYSTAILMIVTAFVLWVMLRSWNRRQARDQAMLHEQQPLSGNTIVSIDRLQYVATTPAGQPLERVAPPGLSFRGPASLQVLTDGVRVQVAGEPVVNFAREHIMGTETSQLTIDRVVEKNGLASLVWRAADENSTLHHTTFRFADPTAHRRFDDAVAEMLRDEPSASADTHPLQETT